MSTSTPHPRLRRLLGLALATALVGPLVTPALLNGTASPAAATTLTLRQPMPADAVVDMVGINVHTASREHYGDKARVTAALRELGVRHVRDRVYTNRPDQYDRLRALGAEGIGLNVIAGDPTLAGGTPEAIVQTAVRELPGMVESYEGANEWNLKRRPNWAAELRAHQTRLYGAVRANPVHSRVPVMAPALGQREGREELGSLAGIADLGNNHLYMGGREPSWLVDQELTRERALKVPNKQVVVTEAGYHDAMVDPTTHFPTPQDVSADYLPRWVMEYAKRDALTHQVYLYQLMDEGTNNADREDKFGLVRPDFTRKPGFTALKNTLALFEDPGGYQPQPTPLALGVTSTATDVQTLVTQRRDGSYVLAVWRRTSSWQQKDEVRLAVPAVPVTLDLATAMDAAVHTPTTSATPRSTATRTTRVNLSVGNGLQVVKLTAPVAVDVAIGSAPPVTAANHTAWQPSGTAEPGAAVSVQVAAAVGTATAATTALGDGTWSVGVDVSGLPDGDLALTVGATAPTGATSRATATVAKTTRLGAPVITGSTGSTGTVSVQFDAPAETGGVPLTGFEATLVAPDGSSSVTALAPETRSFSAQDLPLAGTYVVSVVALNQVGTGPAASTAVATRGEARVVLTPDRYAVTGGGSVTFTGTLTDRTSGAPLAGRTVLVYSRADDGTRVRLDRGQVVTAADGSWSHRHTPTAGLRYQADVLAADGYGFARSTPTRVIEAR